MTDNSSETINLESSTTRGKSSEQSEVADSSSANEFLEPRLSEASAGVHETTEESATMISADAPQLAAVPTSAGEPVENDNSGSAMDAEEYKQVRQERDGLYQRLLRKQAEFENFRKRMEREKLEFLDYALLRFVKELLPVLDGLERSMEAPAGETVELHKKGIELILKQFREVLSDVGLQPIRAMGRIFDPNLHQAVLREESNCLAENEVIEELQRGYTFKERLLRPSMVKVAVSISPETAGAEPVETEAH